MPSPGSLGLFRLTSIASLHPHCCPPRERLHGREVKDGIIELNLPEDVTQTTGQAEPVPAVLARKARPPHLVAAPHGLRLTHRNMRPSRWSGKHCATGTACSACC